MPLAIHVLGSNFSTYKLSKEVLRIIGKGLEAFRLFDDDYKLFVWELKLSVITNVVQNLPHNFKV
jgi:hypothetical protein